MSSFSGSVVYIRGNWEQIEIIDNLLETAFRNRRAMDDTISVYL